MKSVNAEYPLSRHKCAEKCNFSVSVFLTAHMTPLSVSHPPPKMVPSYSLVIWLLKTPKSHRSAIAPSLRKLWFSEDTQFWPKYSNSPGVVKSWQISKVTTRCHKTCLKLSWVQIWQKNSGWEVSQIANKKHSLALLSGGLSVNLNHLKIMMSQSQTVNCKNSEIVPFW